MSARLLPARLAIAHRRGGRVWVSAGVFLACASCTDLQLARYRDPEFLGRYRYHLGEEYISVDGLRFCYQESGQGEDVLILPGLGTSIDFWQLNIPALAEHYHVIAVDPPGIGKSDKPDVSYDLLWICERILAFMDAKQIRRAHLVGGSMGGHLALLLALSDPDRVGKLAMMGSSGTWPPPGPLLDLALQTLWNDALVTDHLRRAWPDIYGKLSLRRRPMTDRILRYQMATRADGAAFAPEGRAFARAMKSIFYHSCRGRLSDITAPTLLIWGQADRYHLMSEAMYFRENLSDVRLVVVPDAAHEVMIDQSALFNRTVLAFLAQGTRGVQDRFPGMPAPAPAPSATRADPGRVLAASGILRHHGLGRRSQTADSLATPVDHD